MMKKPGKNKLSGNGKRSIVGGMQARSTSKFVRVSNVKPQKPILTIAGSKDKSKKR